MKKGLIVVAIILAVCVMTAASVFCGGHHNPVC